MNVVPLKELMKRALHGPLLWNKVEVVIGIQTHPFRLAPHGNLDT